MSIKMEQATRARLNIFKLPKFEFDNIVVDLQHIFTGDIEADAKTAQNTVETAIKIARLGYTAKKRIIVNTYINLHPHVKVAFIQIVHIALSEMKIEPARPVMPILKL